ncbi:MAG: hypothetical protein C0631_10445 [Sedimenticola sp.]|nr:MAG: hypothetical protein C0631_10445 [Sedimenticola sp.]
MQLPVSARQCRSLPVYYKLAIFIFYFQRLIFPLIDNTMKNTMLRNSLKKYNYIVPDGPFISS